MTTFLSEVPGLNITLGNDLAIFAGLAGVVVGPLLNWYLKLKIKTLFLMGFALMFTELALVVIFKVTNLPYCLLVCIMCFEFTYSISFGCYFFTYVSIVGNPA